ncbi:MAG: sialidase family protein, partial [Acutalibacteraceae bacterium]|nr:sialidase family protein [Acutalibacteraceae bacterium]
MQTNVPKIGREVLFIDAKDGNPRNGEGTFLRLKDNSILFVYTKFNGNDWHDECSADIVAFTSYDEGETWIDERILFVHDEKARNYMCVSLIRMNNGDVGLIYLRKDKETINAVPYISRSSDEGKTFSAPERILDGYENYYELTISFTTKNTINPNRNY